MHELPWVIETNDAVKRLIEVEIRRSDPTVLRQEDLSRYTIKVERIRMEVGALRKVKEEAFNFLFAQVSQGQFTDGATVEITTVAALLKCKACGREWGSDDSGEALPLCPKCSSAGAEILHGNELNIVSVDFEYDLKIL